MEKEKTSACPTNIIRDTPSDIDEFSSQSHKRIAKTIVDMIRNEDGGITIGLEGDYGSGKSTIINLIRRELLQGKPKNIKLLLFDAWAHEGNLLRMIFLQKTIQVLKTGQNWFKCSKDAEEILDQIENGRVNNVKMKNRWLIYWMSIIILLLPSAITSFIQGWSDGIVWPWNPLASTLSLQFIYGSAIILIFFILSPIICICHKDDFLELVIFKKVNYNNRRSLICRI